MSECVCFLVVDDQDSIRNFLGDFLRCASFPVASVCNGALALSILRSGLFDVMFTDINMPGISGIQLLQKARGQCPELTTVVMTAYASVENATEAVRLGAYDYLMKPFPSAGYLKQLAERLAGHVCMRRNNQRLQEELAQRNRELSQHVRSLEEAIASLEEKQKALMQSDRMATLGALSAGVAHEINNPTTFVRGNAQTLEKMWPIIYDALQGDVQKCADKRIAFVIEQAPLLLHDMIEGTNRITEIVSGLRFYSHQGKTERIEVKLLDCIHNAFRLVQNRFRRQISVQMEIPEDLPSFFGNAQEITQVFLNLFINAADAMDGQENGRLRISARAEGEDLFIEVADTGNGIPEDVQSRIFDPFFTTKEVGKGTGLGLSIVVGIIRSHGGHIRLIPGGGGGGGGLEVRVSQVLLLPHDIQLPRILIADEDERLRELLVSALQAGRRYEILQASDGKQASAILEQMGPRFFIVSTSLPIRSGIDLIGEAASLAENRPERILALTEFHAPAWESRLRVFGADAVFYKPLQLQKILDFVDRHFSGNKQ